MCRARARNCTGRYYSTRSIKRAGMKYRLRLYQFNIQVFTITYFLTRVCEEGFLFLPIVLGARRNDMNLKISSMSIYLLLFTSLANNDRRARNLPGQWRLRLYQCNCRKGPRQSPPTASYASLPLLTHFAC